MAAHTAELAREDGDVDSIVARIARLRTWAFVANQSGFCADSSYWSGKLSSLEDRLSDALHQGLVSTFVEQRSKQQRGARKAEHRPRGSVEEEPDVDQHHPFAALRKLRVRETFAAESAVPTLGELVDAPHSAFELDASGRISAAGIALGRLVRGSSLAAPNVQLAPLEDAGAGVQRQLQRRLLAFARDATGEMLGALHALKQSEQAPLRAIAYQLEQGLGCASSRELAASLSVLSAEGREQLKKSGVSVGELTVWLPVLLRRDALERRSLLSHVYRPDEGLPPLGRTSYEARHLSADTWLALGYVRLGPRACRVDLAERAAVALRDGASDVDAMRCLSLPKRDALQVARVIREHLAPRAA
jgi:ATP-dependent RNA helicase SUPV3L1/SUV3